MDKATPSPRSVPRNWNMVGYVVFTLAGILFSFWGSDRTQGPMFLALALVFDPYDQNVKWSDRPKWVRGLLIAHLGPSAAMLGYVMSQ